MQLEKDFKISTFVKKYFKFHKTILKNFLNLHYHSKQPTIFVYFIHMIIDIFFYIILFLTTKS